MITYTRGKIHSMCGIVGLFLKDISLQATLGGMLTDMLVTMSDRGPDSAGIAIYRDHAPKGAKITLQSVTPDADFNGLGDLLSEALRCSLSLQLRGPHRARRTAVLLLSDTVRQDHA